MEDTIATVRQYEMSRYDICFSRKKFYLGKHPFSNYAKRGGRGGLGYLVGSFHVKGGKGVENC